MFYLDSYTDLSQYLHGKWNTVNAKYVLEEIVFFLIMFIDY